MVMFLALVSLEFYAERVECRAYGDTLEVNALYYMRSDPTTKFCLLYPLPEEGADFQLVSCENCEVKQRGEVWVMCLDFGPDSLVATRVVYRQRFPEGVFRYITTTTRAWGKPLEKAEFLVEAPWPATVSYRPDTSAEKDGRFTYEMTILGFWPDEDLVFRKAKD